MLEGQGGCCTRAFARKVLLEGQRGCATEPLQEGSCRTAYAERLMLKGLSRTLVAMQKVVMQNPLSWGHPGGHAMEVTLEGSCYGCMLCGQNVNRQEIGTQCIFS